MNERKKDQEKNDGLYLKRIARIRSDFPTKFGIPRQSGLVPELRAKIVFEPEYRRREALEGLEGYSHIPAGVYLPPDPLSVQTHWGCPV